MLLAGLTLAMAAAASPAEEGEPHSHTHAGDESRGEQAPVLLEVTYTGEVIGNARGGVRRGARYLDNLDIVLEADLEALAGWTGARLNLYGLYNNGASISELAGDAQAVSNIETGVQAIRLYEAWIDQKLGDRVSLRAGLYDLNSEFDALDAAGLFAGSAHGIGTDFAQSGRNGPSIFPVTSLAARLEVKPVEGWVVRTAVLDGVPGDPAHPARTAIRFDEGDGALLVGELEAPVAGGRLLLGHWRYTAAFDALDGGRGKSNDGFYLRGEAPLVQTSRGSADAFFRLGLADGRFNMFDRFASAGVRFTGWLPGREEDEFGLAVAAAFTGDDYRALTGAGASEIAFEATYRSQVTDWLAIQPHAQYVRNPSADPAIPDAVVLGLRAEVAFRLLGG